MQRLEYPFPASTVFAGPLVGGNGAAKTNGNGNGHFDGFGAIAILDSMLETLLVVDYRYARFALDERDGLFKMAKCVFVFTRSHGLQA